MKPAKSPKPATDPIAAEVSHLLSNLDFTPEDVVMAAATTPRLFIRAGEYRIDRLRERNQAKMVMEQIEADRSLTLRKEAAAAGEKLTEKNLEAQVTLDVEVVQAQQRYFAADEHDEYAKLVVEAFRMRRDCLEIIGRITGTEISYQKALEANAGKLEDTRRQLRNKFPGGTL